ncbi:peptidylprolyl isomerase [Blastococcus mobilis]|uniref:Peptidyl-prolyl cis-trans isomerase B (Cyclophilin B) n=1 Tax=Blastococcus mobilis TaxID=1938746 RepID=A0A238VDH6_9ACTN|nr:peptidylprolyl isomerase [Blastococcus mobilis]SNR32470.1 peptidyl-prolyl cis-trans isomerase B (cyclophilin B) [Blastococcus mobilis]
MPTNKQRRQAAQRHLQRQLERRAELAKKRRRNLGIVASAIAVLVVVGAALLLTGVFTGDDDPDVSADPGTDTAATVDGSDGTCDFTPDESGNPNLTQVEPPPAEVETTGTTTVTMSTSAGDIGLTLDRAKAPCATASMVHLAEQDFFDDTPCHRLTTSPGLEVLQCGDPSGTGMGGPSYEFPTQVTGDETYPRGTIAMANSGQGTDGSQFFLVYGDSLENNPNYTVLGTIDGPGLEVLDQIAEAGVEGGTTDGAPATPVTITDMAVAAA